MPTASRGQGVLLTEEVASPGAVQDKRMSNISGESLVSEAAIHDLQLSGQSCNISGGIVAGF